MTLQEIIDDLRHEYDELERDRDELKDELTVLENDYANLEMDFQNVSSADVRWREFVRQFTEDCIIGKGISLHRAYELRDFYEDTFGIYLGIQERGPQRRAV